MNPYTVRRRASYCHEGTGTALYKLARTGKIEYERVLEEIESGLLQAKLDDLKLLGVFLLSLKDYVMECGERGDVFDWNERCERW